MLARPAASILPSTSNACSHRPLLRSAPIAEEKVTTSHTPRLVALSSSSSAATHCPARPHAAIAVLNEYTSGGGLGRSSMADSSCSARRHSPPEPHTVIAAL